jgi:hypothetical protein
MRDQLVAKLLPPIQENTTYEHRDKHPCPSGFRTRDSINQAAKTYALDHKATDIGRNP